MDEEESRAARVGQKKMTTPTLVGPTSKKNLPCMTLKKKKLLCRPPCSTRVGACCRRQGVVGEVVTSLSPSPKPQTSLGFGRREEGSNQPPNLPPWLHTTALEPKRAHLKFHEKTPEREREQKKSETGERESS